MQHENAEKDDVYYNVTLVMGASGCGKTSLEQEDIDAAREAGVPVKIIDPQNVFAGDPDAYWGEDLEEHIMALKGKWSGLLVLDDADLYLRNTTVMGSVWHDLLISYRHWQVSIIICSRRPQDIPKLAQDVANTVALFQSRSFNATEAYKKWLGKDLAEKIPKERFHYLLLDMDTNESAEYETKRREQRTAADEH